MGGGSVYRGGSYGGGNYAGRAYRSGGSTFRDSGRVAVAPSANWRGERHRGRHWRGWYGPGIAFGAGLGYGLYDDYPYDSYAYSSEGYYDEDGCYVHWIRDPYYGWRQVRSCE